MLDKLHAFDITLMTNNNETISIYNGIGTKVAETPMSIEDYTHIIVLSYEIHRGPAGPIDMPPITTQCKPTLQSTRVVAISRYCSVPGNRRTRI